MLSTEDLSRVIEDMELSRGIKAIENIKVSAFILTLNVTSNAYQRKLPSISPPTHLPPVVFSFEEINRFALDVSISAHSCTGWTVLQSSNISSKNLTKIQYDLESSSMICEVDNLPEYARLHIQQKRSNKTSNATSYTLRLEEQSDLTYSKLARSILQPMAQGSTEVTHVDESLQGLIDLSSFTLQ